MFYNTCKSPACASCGHWATIQWQRERWCAIPEGTYLEITLTMPNTLWGIFGRHSRLCRKLSEIAARVICNYARVNHGIEVGVLPVLHTFNGELLFKPHVHSLVTAGGLQSSKSRWHPRIYFDRKALVRSWQRLIIAILREASETGQLESKIAGDDLERLLQLEETREWIAHVRAFKGKEHFLRYCGRYVRRPLGRRMRSYRLTAANAPWPCQLSNRRRTGSRISGRRDWSMESPSSNSILTSSRPPIPTQTTKSFRCRTATAKACM